MFILKHLRVDKFFNQDGDLNADASDSMRYSRPPTLHSTLLPSIPEISSIKSASQKEGAQRDSASDRTASLHLSAIGTASKASLDKRERGISLYEHKAEMPDELGLQIGDTLYVLESEPSTGWCVVKRELVPFWKRGYPGDPIPPHASTLSPQDRIGFDVGWVPTACLFLQNEKDAGTGFKQETEEEGLAILQYQAVSQNEISMALDDAVLVLRRFKQWAVVASQGKTGLQVGLVPSSYVTTEHVNGRHLSGLTFDCVADIKDPARRHSVHQKEKKLSDAHKKHRNSDEFKRSNSVLDTQAEVKVKQKGDESGKHVKRKSSSKDRGKGNVGNAASSAISTQRAQTTEPKSAGETKVRSPPKARPASVVKKPVEAIAQLPIVAASHNIEPPPEISVQESEPQAALEEDSPAIVVCLTVLLNSAGSSFAPKRMCSNVSEALPSPKI